MNSSFNHDYSITESAADLLFNIVKCPKLTKYEFDPKIFRSNGLIPYAVIHQESRYRTSKTTPWMSADEFMDKHDIALNPKRLAYTQEHRITIAIQVDGFDTGSFTMSYYTKHYDSMDMFIGGALTPEYKEYDSAAKISGCSEDNAKDLLYLVALVADAARTKVSAHLEDIQKMFAK